MDPTKQLEQLPSSAVFGNDRLLHLLQTSQFRPFQDSKTLVDLPLLVDPQQVLNAFDALSSDLPESKYHEFLIANFASDLEKEVETYICSANPPDYTERAPFFVSNVTGCPSQVVLFACELKRRWSQLCREFRHEAVISPSQLSCTSLISLPHRFFIPGGRFRECYYWDSLWIVKGLIASDMLTSARDVVRNLLSLVRRFGFVPNGNRVYYLNRTQPPILTEAVLVVYNALIDDTARLDWLRETVAVLDSEIDFFHRYRSIASVQPKSRYATRTLSMYAAHTTSPRPESFAEDVETARKALNREAHDVYQNLASAAESGWDFSSRWFAPSVSLSAIRINRIVPVCLNSLLLRAEHTLAAFHRTLAEEASGDKCAITCHLKRASEIDNVASRRDADMAALLWNRDTGMWMDFDLDTCLKSNILSAASVMPIWAGCARHLWTFEDANNFVKSLMGDSGLVRPGGIASTTCRSKEQWDFPNCWAPLVDFAVDALHQISLAFPQLQAEKDARDLACRFVATVFRGWRKDGAVHEKYDCTSNCGVRGVGGEYSPQTGFAWTNGTVLWLMRKYENDSDFFLALE